jgi:ABC-2 type transport system permease protein
MKFIVASIKMFYRDKTAMFFTFFLPILFMTIFGLADFGKFSNVKIGIIDEGKTEQSTKLVEGLGKIDIIDVKQGEPEKLKDDLRKGNIDVVLELPKDLVKYHMVDIDIPGLQLPPTIAKPQKPEFDATDVTVYINESRIQQAKNAEAILKEVFNKMNFEVTQTKEIFNLKEVSISDKKLNYTDYLIPGIISLSIMQMSLMSIIFIIVGYREKGIMKRLQTTPMTSLDFTVSQVVTRLIISIIQVAILLTVAIVFFHINVIGSYGLILLFTVLGSIVFLAMGMVLSSIAKTENAAAPIANVIMMPMMFLGDVFFPVQTMPVWLQNIVKYLPLNYLSDGMRKIMLDGARFSEISTQFYALLIWAAAMIILAILTYRWKNTD